MRSLRAIHNSACSCTGIDSHLFSMFLRVGFEMAVLEARIWLEAAAVVVYVAPFTICLVVGIRNMATQRGVSWSTGRGGSGECRELQTCVAGVSAPLSFFRERFDLQECSSLNGEISAET